MVHCIIFRFISFSHLPFFYYYDCILVQAVERLFSEIPWLYTVKSYYYMLYRCLASCAHAFHTQQQPVIQLISFGFQKKKYPEKKPTILSSSCRTVLTCYARPFCRLRRRRCPDHGPRTNDTPYQIGMWRILFYKPNRNKTSKTREINTFRRLNFRAAGEEDRSRITI